MSNENETINELGIDLCDRHETQEDDVNFILSVIGSPVKKVLEPCCGYERILIPLAKAGHAVSGFDICQEDMDEISKNAGGLKNINWRKANALNDDWGLGFDVVVLAGNILFNIEEIESGMAYKEAQALLIQKAAAALVQGGYVFIEYGPFAPNGRTLTRPGKSCDDDGSICWSCEDYDDDGNFEKDSITSGSFDEETGMLKFKRYIERRLANGKVIKEESERTKHYATLEQIRDWLSAAGFVIEFEYENFNKKPINDDSRKVIIYARKT